uniref:CCHC-type domain-containing protein n=1 Tax=Ananas comosus var. bracteatus TaxID=296719 RepID=A0A6V7PBR6_ANACO|nr:unnamed protein product [Ananas comosus var. bracteatus]
MGILAPPPSPPAPPPPAPSCRHPPSAPTGPTCPPPPSLQPSLLGRAPRCSRVRTGHSFKDAVLTTWPKPAPPYPAFRLPPSNPALPLHPPKYLLNPSLRGRCFRCFERGHLAVCCREPRRCLLCMRIGHPAARCKSLSSRPHRQVMEPGPSSGRPASISSFLPVRYPPAGAPSLSGCVALAEVRRRLTGNVKEVLSRGLAARFGGESRDYGVADFRHSSLAVFFPNWVVRESAIGRSPLRFEGLDFFFSNWQESGELERGHLRHKAWIRLHHWPILCWNEEDVKAAVSGFGELWDIDPLSENQADVSFFRVRIRCQHV